MGSDKEVLDKIVRDFFGFGVRDLLRVIGLLELVRNLSGEQKVYTQRVVGLSRMTEHEDVLDCKYVRLALVDILENHKEDLEKAFDVLGMIKNIVDLKDVTK